MKSSIMRLHCHIVAAYCVWRGSIRADVCAIGSYTDVIVELSLCVMRRRRRTRRLLKGQKGMCMLGQLVMA